MWREVKKRLLPVKARHKRGTPKESPTASNLVFVMFVEELRSFCQVPADISLELLDRVAISTVGGSNNVVYFTREQFATGLRFPISSLVKQFLDFTQGTSCAPISEHLSDLDGLQCAKLSLPIGYFTSRDLLYLHFEVWVGGRLSMSAHSPRLPFVTGLPDSPKTKAKGVVIVRGSWYETSGSLGLPFDLNRSLTF